MDACGKTHQTESLNLAPFSVWQMTTKRNSCTIADRTKEQKNGRKTHNKLCSQSPCGVSGIPSGDRMIE